MPAAPTSGSPQLSDYTTLLRRQWWVVVSLACLGIALALAYTAVAPRVYSSTTSVLVTQTGVVASDSSTSRDATINLDTEAQLMTSTGIVQAAADELTWTGSLSDLEDRLSISVPPNTEILELAFRAPTAAQARAGAQAFADAYLADRQAGAEATVQSGRDSVQSQIDDLNKRLQEVTDTIATLPDGSAARAYNEAQASTLNNQLSSLSAELNQLDATSVTPGRVITQASLPSRPSSPDLKMNVLAGALVGLLLGIGLAVLRQRSDRYVRRPDDVERQVAVPVLVDLPRPETPRRVELVAAGSEEGRTYSRLRNLVTAGSAEGSKVVLVAGVSGPSGQVAANLAASLARAGEDVTLVCADVQASTADQLLDGRAGTGLSEVLAGRVRLNSARRRVPGLGTMRVLGPGRNPEQAAVLLQGAEPRKLLDELAAGSGWVVIEAPATNSGAEAQTLAGNAHLAVLVVETNRTSAQDIIDGRVQIESMHTQVLGAVVVRTGRLRKGELAAETAPAAATAAPAEEGTAPTTRTRRRTRKAGDGAPAGAPATSEGDAGQPVGHPEDDDRADQDVPDLRQASGTPG
jgi:capsular polysaccharide biosynthesis protein